jgi:tetratricopeptide (TPR) repeat protein
MNSGANYLECHRFDHLVLFIGILLLIALGLAKEKAEGFYLERGEKYTNRCRFDQAIANYNKALEIDFGHAEACTKSNMFFVLKDQSDLAISDFNKAIEFHPRDTNYYHK